MKDCRNIDSSIQILLCYYGNCFDIFDHRVKDPRGCKKIRGSFWAYIWVKFERTGKRREGAIHGRGRKRSVQTSSKDEMQNVQLIFFTDSKYPREIKLKDENPADQTSRSTQLNRFEDLFQTIHSHGDCRKITDPSFGAFHT